MSAIASRSTVDTEFSACSVELAPFDASLLVCGTYQIVKDETATIIDEASPPTKRLGRLLLFDVDEEAHLHEIQRTDTSAILDMKQHHQREQLALATSTGRAELYEAKQSEHENVPTDVPPQASPTLSRTRLDHVQSIKLTDEDKLCLSLDWNNRLFASLPAELVVSISDGSCAVVGQRNGAYEVTEAWTAHDYEPWIASFDCWQPEIVWTGGDDCTLKIWDRRRGFNSPIKTNKRFDGGVTTIAPSHLDEHLVAVGSYDAQLRLFDKRAVAQPLAELDVHGGIWRTRWHPTVNSQLLLACMHDGFKVVNMADSALTITTRLEEHDSLAYGADWAVRTDTRTVVGTCSFYDHQLKSWLL